MLLIDFPIVLFWECYNSCPQFYTYTYAKKTNYKTHQEASREIYRQRNLDKNKKVIQFVIEDWQSCILHVGKHTTLIANLKTLAHRYSECKTRT